MSHKHCQEFWYVSFFLLYFLSYNFILYHIAYIVSNSFQFTFFLFPQQSQTSYYVNKYLFVAFRFFQKYKNALKCVKMLQILLFSKCKLLKLGVVDKWYAQRKGFVCVHVCVHACACVFSYIILQKAIHCFTVLSSPQVYDPPLSFYTFKTYVKFFFFSTHFI